jgi:hypothetical protein
MGGAVFGRSGRHADGAALCFWRQCRRQAGARAAGFASAWRGQDKALIAALSKPTAQQNPAENDRLRKEIAETERKLAAEGHREMWKKLHN